MKLLTLPQMDISDLSGALRRIADQIDSGEIEEAHNVAYVIDAGDGEIIVGLLGKAPEPGATAHLLLAMGMRKLELVA